MNTLQKLFSLLVVGLFFTNFELLAQLPTNFSIGGTNVSSTTNPIDLIKTIFIAVVGVVLLGLIIWGLISTVGSALKSYGEIDQKGMGPFFIRIIIGIALILFAIAIAYYAASILDINLANI